MNEFIKKRHHKLYILIIIGHAKSIMVTSYLEFINYASIKNFYTQNIANTHTT